MTRVYLFYDDQERGGEADRLLPKYILKIKTTQICCCLLVPYKYIYIYIYKYIITYTDIYMYIYRRDSFVEVVF